jgi:glycerol-3-phosphate acyltransferase PlsY
MLKGMVAVLLAKDFSTIYAYMPEGIPAIAAFAAVIGHVFPIWLKFRGGKGVATALGALLGIDLYLGLAFIAVWGGVFYFSRISSISAIIAIISSIIFSYIYLNFLYMLAIIAIAILVIYRHTSNIKKLLKGEEKGFK